jgi:hypothetical protein
VAAVDNNDAFMGRSASHVIRISTIRQVHLLFDLRALPLSPLYLLISSCSHPSFSSIPRISSRERKRLQYHLALSWIILHVVARNTIMALTHFNKNNSYVRVYSCFTYKNKLFSRDRDTRSRGIHG